MLRYLHWILLGAFLLAFAFEGIVWAASAQMPTIGVHLLRAAKREAPLTYLYMAVGRPLLVIGPLRDYGAAYAVDTFGESASEIELRPEVAMELAHGPVRNARHATLKLMHFAPLVLFAGWLVTYLLRPRSVHLVRKLRR